MKAIVEDSPMETVAELFDLMVMIQFQKFKNRWPRASNAALMRRLDAWLLYAEPLDPREFKRVSWPRVAPGSSKSSSQGSKHSKPKARATASLGASRGRSSQKRGARETSTSP